MSPDSERLAAARRREATRAAIRYFLLFFALFLFLGALAAYTVRNARQDEARQTPFIRTATGATAEAANAARSVARRARLDRYA